MSVTTDLIGKRVTVRKYTPGTVPLDGSWEDYSGIVRAVSTAKHDENGLSFHLLIETTSSDRKGSRSGPTRLFVADVTHDEVHVVPGACGATNIGSVCSLPAGHDGLHASCWTCPAASRECLIRQQCTNKCGKNDPKP
ncbi:MAG TPA: hypothetical protein VNM90_30650 [Haliangium sp.]|nr:hypothetical protein [Haliangium sp.]